MKEKKELLKSKILEFQQSIPLACIPRKTEIPLNSGKIISVCGVRRCGKTYVLYDTINKLIKNKRTSVKNILFLSFDDERLLFKTVEFDLILQAYNELFPEIKMKDVYIFFDEIQMADGWEPFVRRIYDSATKNIFISGSNSKLLATEIATSLRGRTLQFEIFPLDFKEYCTFRKLNTNYYLPGNKAKIINGFQQYLQKGGFPEIVLNNYRFYETTIQEYYHIMLFKDIVERYDIRNIPVLKYFISRLLANLAKPTSIHKIYNEIKSAGLKTDKNILYELADMLEAIYFTQRLPKYNKSVLKTELANEKKNYFIDNGMVNALNYSYNDDFGKLFENNVFQWLRAKMPFQRGLYFFKGKKECDFVLLDRDKPIKLIQVCWNISDNATLKREVAGLIEASEYLKCRNVFIFTPEHEEVITEGKLKIQIVAAWKEMLK
ncbi:MAG: ATP-binding protein [Bacteroidetes bacterium]|nr:ATP-binding protein [Bacteroidota bacterium]